MKTTTKFASIIAGIIATVLGALAFIGVIVVLAKFSNSVNFSAEFIKTLVFCLLFFLLGSLLLRKGKKDFTKLLILVLMLAAVIIESFVWKGTIFSFAYYALALITQDTQTLLTFSDIYSTLVYITLVFTAVATICHIIAMAMAKAKK
jgi:glucose-6-phosphate-specific signal transduction histidine kinase